MLGKNTCTLNLVYFCGMIQDGLRMEIAAFESGRSESVSIKKHIYKTSLPYLVASQLVSQNWATNFSICFRFTFSHSTSELF